MSKQSELIAVPKGLIAIWPLIVSAITIVFTVGAIYSTFGFRLQSVEQRLDKLESIDRRLSRIEGKLGIEAP